MQKLSLFQNSRKEFSLREARCIWQELPLILPTNDSATPSNRNDNVRKQEMVDKAHADLAANNAPELILPPSNETPSDRAGGKLKMVADALRANPDVRNATEQQAFKLRLNLALKSALKNANSDPGFRRLNANNSYRITMGADNTATVLYNTADGRVFVAKSFAIGAAGERPTQQEIIKRIGDIIAKPANFGEVIAPQINQN